MLKTGTFKIKQQKFSPALSKWRGKGIACDARVRHDMAAAAVMGPHNPEEIPIFNWAVKSGMKPEVLAAIEIRGEKTGDVKRDFKKPQVVPWGAINKVWGVAEL